MAFMRSSSKIRDIHAANLAEILRLAVMAGVCFAFLPNPALAGTLASWGAGQVPPPAGLNNVTAISCSCDHSLALKGDGTVSAWGNNMNYQCSIPAGLANVIGVAAGEFYSLALLSNGTVRGWGADDYNQLEVPSGLASVRAISAGHAHCLALKSDGTVVA